MAKVSITDQGSGKWRNKFRNHRWTLLCFGTRVPCSWYCRAVLHILTPAAGDHLTLDVRPQDSAVAGEFTEVHKRFVSPSHTQS